MHLTCFLHIYQNENTGLYICSGIDSVDRLSIENELSYERKKIQSYMDVVGVMLLVLNRDQTVNAINRKGTEILERSESDIVGKNWFDNFVPESINEDIKKRFNVLMKGKTPDSYYENPVVTSNGTNKIILWHSTLLYDEKGDVAGLLSSGEDISNIRKVEKELIKHVRTFEALYALSEGIALSKSLKDIAERTSNIFTTNNDILAGGFYILKYSHFGSMR